MSINELKKQDYLEKTLTENDGVGLEKLYKEVKELEKDSSEKTQVEIAELKLIIGHETIYIMEYGKGYLIEKGDTVSHINAMLPDGYSIQVTNPKKIFSGDNLRVAIKNGKVVINDKIIEDSSIQWGEKPESIELFEQYKLQRWAKECFMKYDAEKKVFSTEDAELVIKKDDVKSLDDLKKKTEEYREKKLDEKASKLADEVGVSYDSKNNSYVCEDGKLLITRERVENKDALEKMIKEYREQVANDIARGWAQKRLNIEYNESSKLYVIDGGKLNIKRDDVLVFEELEKAFNEYQEKILNEKAQKIASEVGVSYDIEKKYYICEGGKLNVSREFVKNAHELNAEILKYKEALANDTAKGWAQKLGIEYNASSKLYIIDGKLNTKRDEISSFEQIEKIYNEYQEKIKGLKPAFFEYKIKGGDMLWAIIKDNFEQLGIKDNVRKSISEYYTKFKDQIVEKNGLKMSNNGDPIILAGKDLFLPIIGGVSTPGENKVDTIVAEKKTVVEDKNKVADSILPEKKVIIEDINKIVDTVVPKNFVSEKKPSKESIRKEEDRKFNITKSVRELLEKEGINRNSIMGIDIKVENNIEQAIAYIKTNGESIRRSFQISKDGNKDKITELNDSSNKYKFRLFLNQLVEEGEISKDNLFVSQTDEKNFKVSFSLEGVKSILERQFQIQEDSTFKETTGEKELTQIKLCENASMHGLSILETQPANFAKVENVEGNQVFVYKMKIQVPGDEPEEGNFYLNEYGLFTSFLK